MRWLAVVVLMSGCDVVFRLDDVKGGMVDAGDAAADQDSAIDAMTDAGLVGDRPWFCQTAQVFDDMSGATPCTWGVVLANSRLMQHNGVLDINFTSTTQPAFYGCTAYGPFAALSDDGVFAKVDAVLALPSAYTKLAVRNALNTTPAVEANFTYDGALKFYLNGSVIAVDSTTPTPTWWRIRNPQGTSELAAELSADGEHWTRLAVAQSAMPSQIAVDIGAGVTVMPTTAGKATISALGICL